MEFGANLSDGEGVGGPGHRGSLPGAVRVVGGVLVGQRDSAVSGCPTSFALVRGGGGTVGQVRQVRRVMAVPPGRGRCSGRCRRW